MILAQAHPVHLWDAVTGELRCSYLGFDDKDEVSAAFSVAFSADGSQLVAGGNKLLRLFDVGKPGRECYIIKTHSKKHPGQPGAGLPLRGISGADAAAHWRLEPCCSYCA